jgi:hypothetical protein
MENRRWNLRRSCSLPLCFECEPYYNIPDSGGLPHVINASLLWGENRKRVSIYINHKLFTAYFIGPFYYVELHALSKSVFWQIILRLDISFTSPHSTSANTPHLDIATRIIQDGEINTSRAIQYVDRAAVLDFIYNFVQISSPIKATIRSFSAIPISPQSLVPMALESPIRMYILQPRTKSTAYYD